VSDGVGSRQTTPFRLFEEPRRAFDSKPIDSGFSGLFAFSELPQQIFCKVNFFLSFFFLFFLLFHREYLAIGSSLAQG